MARRITFLSIATTFIFALTLMTLPTAVVSASETYEKSFLIYEIQTGSPTSASSEFVSIVNASTKPQRLNGLCVHYSAASSDLWLQRSCFNDVDDYTQLWIVAGGVAYIASDVFISENPSFLRDSQLSGAMAANGGAVKLTKDSRDLDTVGWGTSNYFETIASVAPSNSQLLRRITNQAIVQDADNNSIDFALMLQGIVANSGVFEVEIPRDICVNIEGFQTEIPLSFEVIEGDCLKDVCENIEGFQESIEGYELTSDGLCIEVELVDSVIEITELLPNVSGADDGKEFIELHNPNDFVVNLEGYSLVLGSKSYVFPSLVLASGGYLALYDSDTGLVLPNTTGEEVVLIAQSRSEVSRSTIYVNAPDDQSWSKISGQWQFSNQPTPGSVNRVSLSNSIGGENLTDELDECPEGKFRNPLTNRCKTIETVSDSLVPCDADEYRNPATNRCNKLSSSTSSLKPCAANQERNTETNRCRAISSSDSLEPCEEGKERNPETNRCRTVATLASVDSDGNSPALTATILDVPAPNTGVNWMIIMLVITGSALYMVYEWREELSKTILKIRSTGVFSK